MYSFATSLYLKMKQMGYDVALASSLHKDGGEIDFGKFGVHRFIPWSEAVGKECINIFHSDVPPPFNKLENRVFWAHGSPHHVFLYDYVHGTDGFATSAYLIENCDLVIVTNPSYIQYWQEIAERDKVRHVPGGVDLDRFKPEGKSLKFSGEPSVGYLDPIRPGVKDPFNLLFAMKKVGRNNPKARLVLGGISQDKVVYLSYVAGRIKLDINLDTVVVGMYKNVTEIYRGLDMIVSPLQGGIVSTVAAEAMACGCPAIVLEGSDMQAYAKCRDDPVSMASAIEEVWSQVREDRVKVRSLARKIALENYDIRRTVDKLRVLLEEFFGAIL